MNLSPHFTLEEFTTSQTATRHSIPNVPPAVIVDELARLCETILEPLREMLGRPIHISSGYRSPVLNRLVGGAPDSAHLYGRAADIIVPPMPPLDVCRAIAESTLPFDQVIHEGGAWTHAAIAAPQAKPRRELLTAYFSRNSGARYVAGLQPVPTA